MFAWPMCWSCWTSIQSGRKSIVVFARSTSCPEFGEVLMAHRTEQEEFWAGAFGTDYIRRNMGSSLLAANLGLFAQALRMTRPPRDVIEFGANIGMNLQALKLLYPDQQQFAIEINAD